MENKYLEMVREFHEAFDIIILDHGETAPEELERLRKDLLIEELEELRLGMKTDDKVEVLDAIIDSVYIMLGSRLSLGVYRQYQEDMFRESLSLNSIIDFLKSESPHFLVTIEYDLNELFRDVLTYYYGGYNVDLGKLFEDAFKEVHRSNMSKACASMEEAEKTVDYYLKNKNVKSYIKPHNGKFLVLREDGKLLKSISYSPANLANLKF